MELFALTPDASDFFTLWGFVVGVISLVVGVVAFWFAIVQIREARDSAKGAKDAAEAARDAATKTLAENKEAYERFVSGFASRLLSDLQRAVSAKEWSFAAIRAQDLAELLGTLPEAINGVSRLVLQLRVFGQKFSARPEDSDPKYALTKWNTLLNELHARLDQLRAPFRAPNRVEEAHDTRTGTPTAGGGASPEDAPPPSELG